MVKTQKNILKTFRNLFSEKSIKTFTGEKYAVRRVNKIFKFRHMLITKI